MKRRSALRSLALVVGGTLTLPAWAHSWNLATVAPTQKFISPATELLLAELVETIIPATDTPGAKALGVHRFILTMLADCYEKTERNRFRRTRKLNELVQASMGKSFIDCDPDQRLEILRARENAAQTLPAEKDPFSVPQKACNSGVFKFRICDAEYI
jgi:hypothetical protein